MHFKSSAKRLVSCPSCSLSHYFEDSSLTNHAHFWAERSKFSCCSSWYDVYLFMLHTFNRQHPRFVQSNISQMPTMATVGIILTGCRIENCVVGIDLFCLRFMFATMLLDLALLILWLSYSNCTCCSVRENNGSHGTISANLLPHAPSAAQLSE